jgi:hypothetical protein
LFSTPLTFPRATTVAAMILFPFGDGMRSIPT